MISISLSHDYKYSQYMFPLYGRKYPETMNQNEFFFLKQFCNKFCNNDTRIIINMAIIPLQPLTLQFTSKPTTSLSYSTKCQTRPWNNMHLQIQSRISTDKIDNWETNYAKGILGWFVVKSKCLYSSDFNYNLRGCWIL